MKNLKDLFMVGVAALLFASCGTTTRTRSFSPQVTHLQYTNDDLEFVGEMEVSVNYSTWLGVFYQIHTLNGVEYDSSAKKKAQFTNGVSIPTMNGKLNKAAYAVVEKFPEARFYQVVRVTSEKEKLFLGNEITRKALIRAYKLREGHKHCTSCSLEKVVKNLK